MMMPITKDHAMAAGVVVAVAMGAASLLRTPAAAPAPVASAGPISTDSPQQPPPNHCKEACASLASWCSAGRAVNCVDLLNQYQYRERKVANASMTDLATVKEGVINPDTGKGFTCEDKLTQRFLDLIGWCPDGGEEKPMVFGVRP